MLVGIPVLLDVITIVESKSDKSRPQPHCGDAIPFPAWLDSLFSQQLLPLKPSEVACGFGMCFYQGKNVYIHRSLCCDQSCNSRHPLKLKLYTTIFSQHTASLGIIGKKYRQPLCLFFFPVITCLLALVQILLSSLVFWCSGLLTRVDHPRTCLLLIHLLSHPQGSWGRVSIKSLSVLCAEKQHQFDDLVICPSRVFPNQG